MMRLINAFGESVPESLSPTQWVDWLAQFCLRWDYRRLQKNAQARDINEGARWLISDGDMNDKQKAVAMEAAHALGLIGIDSPSLDHYDYILVLGGARMSCLLRPRFASSLLKNGTVATSLVANLGAMRPVAATEREATDTYAPGADNEYELMNAGAEQSFDLPPDFSEETYYDQENANKNWAIRKYHVLYSGATLVSIAAPSSEPEKRRANSADTFHFFFTRFRIPAGSTFLLITSQIYVPYQQLEAIRILAIPHGMMVETVGVPSNMNIHLGGMTQPSNYLQEIRSTILSAQRFIQAYPVEEGYLL